MQLSTYSDYALRVLMRLALEPQRRQTIRDIADAYGISQNHLMKVAQELGRLGYVATLRGRGGGLRLRRPADEINIGAVVRRTEGNLALVECFDPATNSCIITGACRLKAALAEALEAFFAVLDGYSLADLVGDGGALSAILLPPDSDARRSHHATETRA